MWWQRFQFIAAVVRVLGAVWAVLGWFGLTAAITGFAIATIGAWQAVLVGVPVPIAIMVGFCVFALTCQLALIPAMYRALNANPAVTGEDKRTTEPNYGAWKNVHSFTVSEAASLFENEQPSREGGVSAKAATWLPAFRSAIVQRELKLDPTYYNKDEIQQKQRHPTETTRITRVSLVSFAKNHGLAPRFLRADLARD